jgi:basic membrane lipoprotein Med (substrate-binding protein (PBP1-ABC) superfamily)
MNPIHRRDSLKSLAALGVAGTLGGWNALAQAQKPLTVGVIYVGPRDDYGYNQAHAQAAAEIKKMPGIKVVEEENVPETAAVQKAMTGMIQQDGAKLLFPTSFGYFDPHILAVAPKNPDVRFSHCGGLWSEGMPKNAGSFFGYIDECQFLNGVVAAHMTKSNKIAFVAAKRGKMVCGYHASQAKLAPQAYLTGAEWNWLTAYRTAIEAAQSGKPHPNFLRGGLKEGYVKMSPYGPAVTDAAKKQADGIKAQMVAGGFDIFKGPLKDNKGKEIIASGKTLKQTDIELEKTNYLVEGVLGSI